MPEHRGTHHTPEAFPPTRHSVIVSVRDGDEDARRRAHEVIVETYWRPVYTYVRLYQRATPEDAEDLTQGFFLRAIDADFFSGYDPERARFRTYLRVCLDRFVANERKRARRLKRGGGAGHIPLDFETAEGDLRRIEVADGDDPEAVFRREWVRTLFGLAVDDVQRHFEAQGRPVPFRVFERYDIDRDGGGDGVSYAGLAREFDIPVTQVTNYLAAARRRFRAALLERIREQSGSDDEFRADVRDILGSDAAS